MFGKGLHQKTEIFGRSLEVKSPHHLSSKPLCKHAGQHWVTLSPKVERDAFLK